MQGFSGTTNRFPKTEITLISIYREMTGLQTDETILSHQANRRHFSMLLVWHLSLTLTSLYLNGAAGDGFLVLPELLALDPHSDGGLCHGDRALLLLKLARQLLDVVVLQEHLQQNNLFVKHHIWVIFRIKERSKEQRHTQSDQILVCGKQTNISPLFYRWPSWWARFFPAATGNFLCSHELSRWSWTPGCNTCRHTTQPEVSFPRA